MNIDHAAIRDFLQQQTIRVLHPLPLREEGDLFTKAGVLPFIKDTRYLYYMMKPRGVLPELGEPPFQICKGTRQYWTGTEWKDMRGEGADAGKKETLAETALREGIEELGLKLDNIKGLLDLGPFEFASATTGRPKQMWLFAAEMIRTDDFLPDDEVGATTAARKWLSTAEFEVVGREDHLYILRQIETILTQHFQE